jgi:signal transduction histidine kinase
VAAIITSGKLRHDLRTPLNHLVGYGELITEALEDSSGSGESESDESSTMQDLKALVLRARELVPVLENLPEDKLGEAVVDAELPDLVERLAPKLEAAYPEDFAKMRQAAARLESLAEAIPRETATCILVVDDDEDNRQLLRRILERQGYAVTLAASGPECLELMEHYRFDLVLLDVMMPGLSGFEVLSRIRENPEMRSVPVVVVSALGESSAAIRCLKMGAEDYLPKPFDPVLLKARIGASLERKRLRDKEARYAHDLESALVELRGAKDKLVVQEKLASLGALTAGIAHELKNPLNFITNFASLSCDLARDLERELAKPQPDPAEIHGLLQTLRENLTRVETHGMRADHIVRGMLQHSYGQAGHREPTDVNSLVEEALNLAYHGMRAQNSSFNVAIERRLAAGLPLIPVIAQDISRVLVNILNNAFYAVEEKRKSGLPAYAPTIRATTRDFGDSIEIVLEDNGPGIPAPIAQKIFDPFFTTKPAGAGTGLGLSISYDIVVRSHGGELSSETTSENEPGSFARFRVVLPKTVKS